MTGEKRSPNSGLKFGLQRAIRPPTTLMNRREKLSETEAGKLEPCPWCGKVEHLAVELSVPYWSVACLNVKCPAKPDMWFGSSKSEAIEAWNTRADSSRERVEELVEALEWILNDYAGIVSCDFVPSANASARIDKAEKIIAKYRSEQ